MADAVAASTHPAPAPEVVISLTPGAHLPSEPARRWSIPVMAKGNRDFTEILLRKQVLGADQLEEARGLAIQTGAKIQDALIKLGYATAEQIMDAVAEFHGMQFVDLTDVTVPA